MKSVYQPLNNGTIVGNTKRVLSIRRERNIEATISAMHESFVKMAQEYDGLGNVLIDLRVEIVPDHRYSAEDICRDTIYRSAKGKLVVKRTGKPQNKSGETPPNGYAKTVGKPQNKLGDSAYSDNTDLTGWADSLTEDEREARIEAVIAHQNRRTFEVMQDIHLKDGVYYCYDKTIIAALHTPHGIFLGTNGIKKQPSQHKCPRKGDGINQGYDKCVKQCQQPAHAELAALQKYKALVAEPDFENSQMVVYGAKEVCYHCKTTLELVGIQRIILKPLNQLGEIHDYQ